MYIIKPLVWFTPPKRVHFYIAHTIFGDIHIDDHGHDVFVNMIGVLGEETTHKGMDAAKSYAEAWYHNRIREALEYVGESEAATFKYLSDSGSDAGCRCSNLCGTCQPRVDKIIRNCMGVNPGRRERVLWSGVVMIVVLLNWWVTCVIFIKSLWWGILVSVVIAAVGLLATWIEESIRDFNATSNPSDGVSSDVQDHDEGTVRVGRGQMERTQESPQAVDWNEAGVDATKPY